MSPPLEIMNALCSAFQCPIATKMAPVKPVTNDPASRLTDSDTNLLRLTIVSFPWLTLHKDILHTTQEYWKANAVGVSSLER
jgi:hypothetical protein